LKNMLDIVAACILLHNICIVNNEGIEKDWILKVESKLIRRIIEGDVREGSELRGEKAGIAEVRRIIRSKGGPKKGRPCLRHTELTSAVGRSNTFAGPCPKWRLGSGKKVAGKVLLN
jgi:hypothetical protein